MVPFKTFMEIPHSSGFRYLQGNWTVRQMRHPGVWWTSVPLHVLWHAGPSVTGSHLVLWRWTHCILPDSLYIPLYSRLHRNKSKRIIILNQEILDTQVTLMCDNGAQLFLISLPLEFEENRQWHALCIKCINLPKYGGMYGWVRLCGNNKLASVWMEVVVAYFEVVLQH